MRILAIVRALFCLGFVFLTVQTFAQGHCPAVIGVETSHYYNSPQFKIVDQKPGPHGKGQIFRVSLRSAVYDWHELTEFKFFENAPLGDTRRNVQLLPPEIPKFFGFRLLDENLRELPPSYWVNPKYIEVPDVDSLNATFEKINKALKSQGHYGFPFRFKLEPGLTTSEDFVYQFFDLNEIPFSSNPKISFHDLNYHLFPLFVMDRGFHEQALLKTEVVLLYAKWLKKKYKGKVAQADIDVLFEARANQLDVFANVREVFHQRMLNEDAGMDPVSMRAVNGFIGGASSAVEYIKWLAASLSEQRGHVFLEKKVEEFVASLEGQPRYFQNSGIKPIDVLPRMLDRVEEIRQAVISSK